MRFSVRFFFALITAGLLAGLPSVVSAQVSFGNTAKCNKNWKFTLSNPENAASAEIEESAWKDVELPHDWSVEGTASRELASCTGYLPGGIGWYRKVLEFPESAASRKHYIYFEGVYNHSEVYLNGKLLGKRPNGYISFMYDLTLHIDFGKKNILAVKVDHSEDADSRWYSGSGIYRNVYLIEAGPVHIAPRGVFFKAKKEGESGATIEIDIEVQNTTAAAESLEIRTSIIDRDGKTVAKSGGKLSVPAVGKAKATLKANLDSSNLWGCKSPYLYELKTEILKDCSTVDENVQKIGIRFLEFDPNKGFALNGEWMKLKGVCIHHDAGVLGAAVPRDVWARRLENLKKLGVNAIRTSHNPQSPDLYELCDEMGILVIDEAFDEWEFPKRKWLEGWNVGAPGFQGNYSFFKEWADRDMADMVFRDRNHPSVVMWSIGNEVDYPNDPYSHPVLDGSSI